MSNPTLTLTGQSGNKYNFTVYPIGTNFNAVGGLYLITRKELYTDTHHYIYLGETSDYSNRFKNHHKAKEINALNPTHICTYRSDDYNMRCAIEADILGYITTPCNEQLN